MNGLDLQNQKATNAADPTSATDLTTKQYVDAKINGLAWKEHVRAATTAAGTLASSFANGSVIDGVTLATGDPILIKNQATGSENGIYTVAASGAPTRRADANTSALMDPNTTVAVSEGTVNQDTAWTLTTNAPITLGTTALVFALGPGVGGGTTYTNGTGISIAGSVISVDFSVAVKKFAANLGAITGGTPITVNHALGTTDVTVSVKDTSTLQLVFPDIVITDANNIALTFAASFGSAAYRCVVHG
jgi:phage-related tail fiber protein